MRISDWAAAALGANTAKIAANRAVASGVTATVALVGKTIQHTPGVVRVVDQGPEVAWKNTDALQKVNFPVISAPHAFAAMQAQLFSQSIVIWHLSSPLALMCKKS